MLSADQGLWLVVAVVVVVAVALAVAPAISRCSSGLKRSVGVSLEMRLARIDGVAL